MILTRSYRATGRPDLELGKPPRGGACTVGEHLLHDMPNVDPRLAELLDAIAEADKTIGYELRRFGLNQMAGMSGRKNTRGDGVHRMDEFAHRVLRDACEACEAVSSVSSEESEEPEEFARASAAYDEARHELNMSNVKVSIYGNREGLLDRCWACQKSRAGTCRRHHAKVAQLAREKHLRTMSSSSQSKK